MKRPHNFTCIRCPLSCQIELIEEDNNILKVMGNRCKQGERYVIDEFTNPVRTVITTLYTEEGILPMLPVRSERPIPKHLMKECMKELAKIRVKAPVKCGGIVHKNILDTGINIIASRDMSKRK